MEVSSALRGMDLSARRRVHIMGRQQSFSQHPGVTLASSETPGFPPTNRHSQRHLLLTKICLSSGSQTHPESPQGHSSLQRTYHPLSGNVAMSRHMFPAPPHAPLEGSASAHPTLHALSWASGTPQRPSGSTFPSPLPLLSGPGFSRGQCL